MGIDIIASAATGMKQGALEQAVSLAVTRKVMDVEQQNGDNMVKLLETAVMPHLGGNVDINV